MEDESYLFNPLLEDGDSSNLVHVHVRRSLMEKLWGILLQSPAASWLSFPSDIKYGAARFQEKSTKEKATMTRASGSPIRSVQVLIPILILIMFLLAILSFSLFIWPLRKQQSPSVPHPNVVVAKNLNVATLLEARDQEQGAMRDCLDKAVQEFSTEPSLVMKNARMILHCNGTKQEFVSGNGGTRIEVVWINDMAGYSVSEASAEVYVARLARRLLPLSLTGINEILRDLASWNGSEEMQECLSLTLQKFCEEPTIVQDNAKVVVSCGNKLTFISGKGQNEISVYRGSAYEEIQYRVKATGWAQFVKFWKGQWK